MKTNGMVAIGGLVICGAAAWIALDAHRAAASARATAAQRSSETAALTARVQEAVRKATAADARRAELQSRLKAFQGGSRAAPERQVTTESRNLERAVLLNDPPLQALWAKATRARITRAFGSFYAERGLTPGQIAQLEAALLKREEAKLDLAAASAAQGPESKVAVATLQADVEAEFQSAVTAALGNEAPRQLQEYERSLGPRMIVATIGSWASLEGAPLTDGQVRHLAATLASSGPDAPGRAAGIDWNVVDAEARRILNPAQLAIVGRVRVESDLDAALAEARKADAAAKTGASATPLDPEGGTRRSQSSNRSQAGGP